MCGSCKLERPCSYARVELNIIIRNEDVSAETGFEI